MKHGPWTITASKELYRSPWLVLKEDQVIQPSGKPGIFATVWQKPGVYVVTLDKDGDTHLIRQFAYAIGKDSIEVVSGGIDDGEKPLDAAKRELREEIGIDAQEWIPLGQCDVSTTLIDSPQYMFLARGLSHGATHLDENERIEKIKLRFDEAVAWAMQGKITDAISCVALLKAAKYLKR